MTACRWLPYKNGSQLVCAPICSPSLFWVLIGPREKDTGRQGRFLIGSKRQSRAKKETGWMKPQG